MNISEIRKHFPHLSTDQVYFNHAAVSPLSNYVKNSIDEYLLERSKTNVENFFDFLPKLKETQNKLANLLNAEPTRIAWMDNVTNGLNLLAQGLQWKEGDQIILNDLEFPANVYPFLNLRSKGVKVNFAESENGKVDLEQIKPLVNEKTKLISISFVQFLTGYKADLKRIGEFCNKNNIIFCVDGIQGVPVCKLDVKEYNIDFFAGGCQKWLMGTTGLGYIFLTEELQSKIYPAYVGWLSVDDAWNLLDYNLNLRPEASRFQNGTINMIGLAALNGSLKLFDKFGYQNIYSRIKNNTKYFVRKLNSIGMETLSDIFEDENLSGIITFKSDEAQKIFDELKNQNIHCSVREGMIRFSPHFYNTEEEIDRVIDSLKNL